MQPEVDKYLYDVIQAGELVRQFVALRSLEEYREDALLRSAVERQFEIIGEALTQALRLAPELGAAISYSRRVIAFRNILAHQYSVVRDDDVWSIIHEYLPTLLREAAALMGDQQA